MATNSDPKKARLIELDATLKNEKSGGKSVTVQFNPDTLKLQFANQIQNSNPSASGSGAGAGGGSGAGGGGGDQSQGTSGRQFLGAGTTKLAVTLWFDAATANPPVDDVRRLTQEVVYFITAQPTQSDATRFAPPGLRFSWGSFVFDGLVDGIEESIDYFSAEGHPLRASINLSLSQQTILVADFGAASRPPGVGAGAGTTPMTLAAAGSTLQGLAAAAGAGGNWQAIATANGIDNPRALAAGQLVNLSARLPRSPF
jgi:hypothetical protein